MTRWRLNNKKIVLSSGNSNGHREEDVFARNSFQYRLFAPNYTEFMSMRGSSVSRCILVPGMCYVHGAEMIGELREDAVQVRWEVSGNDEPHGVLWYVVVSCV
jgi:hypothetical protein